MSTEKLSELSKPVAWNYEWASCITTDGPQDFKSVIECEAPPQWAVDEGQARGITPLYSQEYVSALIQRAERLDSMLTESVQALKETEQKSSELEQAMRHIHGAELAVEHALMEEQSNG